MYLLIIGSYDLVQALFAVHEPCCAELIFQLAMGKGQGNRQKNGQPDSNNQEKSFVNPKSPEIFLFKVDFRIAQLQFRVALFRKWQLDEKVQVTLQTEVALFKIDLDTKKKFSRLVSLILKFVCKTAIYMLGLLSDQTGKNYQSLSNFSLPPYSIADWGLNALPSCQECDKVLDLVLLQSTPYNLRSSTVLLSSLGHDIFINK